MKVRHVVAAVAAIATVGCFGVAQVGAGAIPASITLEIDPSTGPVGTVINATGECTDEFEDGECESVLLFLFDPENNEVDRTTVDALPEYEGSLTVPADGPCGTYLVMALGEDAAASLPFEVPCPEPPPSSESTTTQSVAATGATRPTFTG